MVVVLAAIIGLRLHCSVVWLPDYLLEVSLCVCAPGSVYVSLSYQEDNYKISILPLCRWTLSYFDHICQDFIFKAFVSVGGYSVSPQRAMN